MVVEDRPDSYSDAALERLQRSYNMEADELLRYVKRYGMHRHFKED